MRVLAVFLIPSRKPSFNSGCNAFYLHFSIAAARSIVKIKALLNESMLENKLNVMYMTTTIICGLGLLLCCESCKSNECLCRISKLNIENKSAAIIQQLIINQRMRSVCAKGILRHIMLHLSSGMRLYCDMQCMLCKKPKATIVHSHPRGMAESAFRK